MGSALILPVFHGLLFQSLYWIYVITGCVCVFAYGALVWFVCFAITVRHGRERDIGPMGAGLELSGWLVGWLL